MVHNASDAGMSRSQIAAALGVTPARAHQLATQDLPGMISWIPFSAFVRQAEVSALEAAELLRDATVIALPDSHPPMFRRHELGAALERIRGGLHSGMTVTVANGIRSQRDDRLLEGKSGRFVRVIAVGERPVVEIDIAEEGPTFLFLDQVIPASALSDG